MVALERGPWRDTATDFATGFAQDELRYMWRHHLFQNVADDTLTIRNNVNQEALPMRHLGSFLLGTGVGSGGVHWNGQIWRFLPTDFLTKSHNEQRYGKKAVTDYDMTVQDWGITYEELEPHYDQFDKLCGTSGKAGNLQRQDPARRQSLRGPAQRTNIPTRRWRRPTGRPCSARRRPNWDAIRSRIRPAIMSQAYTNPLGRADGRVHLLRILREIWLRQLFQGESADHGPALSDARRRISP